MIFMALMCGLVLRISSSRIVLYGRIEDQYFRPQPRAPLATLVAASIAVTALIALLTPPLYTTWRPTWLPWQIESYIDGCHNLGAPQPWLFSIFPWAAFAFAGLAAGFILFSDRGRERTVADSHVFAAIGGAAILIASRSTTPPSISTPLMITGTPAPIF